MCMLLAGSVLVLVVACRDARVPTEDEASRGESSPPPAVTAEAPESVSADPEVRFQRIVKLHIGFNPEDEEIRRLLREHPSWPDEIISDVADGYVRVGMTREQANEARGPPMKVNWTKTARGLREVWVYPESRPEAEEDELGNPEGDPEWDYLIF